MWKGGPIRAKLESPDSFLLDLDCVFLFNMMFVIVINRRILNEKYPMRIKLWSAPLLDLISLKVSCSAADLLPGSDVIPAALREGRPARTGHHLPGDLPVPGGLLPRPLLLLHLSSLQAGELNLYSCNHCVLKLSRFSIITTSFMCLLVIFSDFLYFLIKNLFFCCRYWYLTTFNSVHAGVFF